MNTEIILEGGPFDGEQRRVKAGEIVIYEALKAITDDTPEELRGLFTYYRAGRQRGGKPVFVCAEATRETTLLDVFASLHHTGEVP